MLGVEWYKREEVFQQDRDFYREGVGRSEERGRRLLERDRRFTGPRRGRYRHSGGSVESSDPSGRRYVVRDVRLSPRERFATTTRSTSRRTATPFTFSGINYHGPIMSYEENGDGFPVSGSNRTAHWRKSPPPVSRRRQPSAVPCSVARTSISTTISRRSRRRTYSNIKVVTRGGYPPAITVWQRRRRRTTAAPVPPGLQALLDSLQPGDPTGADRS